MKLCVVTVGKRHDATISDAIEEYLRWLKRAYTLDWIYVAPSSMQFDDARKAESAKILSTVKSSDIVWLLDERGEQITSPALAAKMQVLRTHAISRLVVIIGGAYGVDDTVRERADWVWSLSKLVFPHQLVRLLVTEQLYRASEIEKGTGYHHA